MGNPIYGPATELNAGDHYCPPCVCRKYAPLITERVSDYVQNVLGEPFDPADFDVTQLCPGEAEPEDLADCQ